MGSAQTARGKEPPALMTPEEALRQMAMMAEFKKKETDPATLMAHMKAQEQKMKATTAATAAAAAKKLANDKVNSNVGEEEKEDSQKLPTDNGGQPGNQSDDSAHGSCDESEDIVISLPSSPSSGTSLDMSVTHEQLPVRDITRVAQRMLGVATHITPDVAIVKRVAQFPILNNGI